MASSVRRRARENISNISNNEDSEETFIHDISSKPRLSFLSPLFYSIYLICFGIILYFSGSYFNDVFPTPNQNKLNGFVAERAIDDLKGLVDIGPKVTGSEENEVIAINYIMNIIDDISKTANPIHQLEVDLQKVSGSFSIWGVGLHYDNVQNIVVKLGPRNNASLLINCHFDSVPTSPGASDDGLNCAVMLEVLRIISSLKNHLSFGVIFLFNGAEENPLLASHGFITKHKWAKEVKAFINLESCGAGGHEVLFQTGPNCSWVVEAYSEAVIHPSGNVVGEELFQSGIIPSDTDFRIFRDYGHIPGLDFAHCRDGYVYHTRRDNLESIVNMAGVIQHTGDNMLSLVLTFTGNSSKMANLHYSSKDKSIYFDVLGLFFITYSQHTALLINCITILTTVICLGIVIRPTMNFWILANLFVRSVALLVGLGLSLIYNLLLAIIMDSMSASMSWFTQSYLLVPLYIIPTVALTSLPVSLIHFFLLRQKSKTSFENALVQFLPTQLFWTLLLLVCTLMKTRSAFLLVMLVLPPALAFMFLTLFYDRATKLAARMIYFISTCFSSLFIVYCGIQALRLFLPITGRAGPTLNPDLPISGLVTLLTFATFSYICCFSTYVPRIQKWTMFMMLFHAIVTFIIINSNIGFPFSSATPQRILISDVTRNGTEPQSFLWIEPWERRGFSVIPRVATLPKVKPFCTKEAPHCGLPWTNPKLFMKSADVSRWLPSTPLKQANLSQLEVLSDEISSHNIRVVSLKMVGPDHMTLLIHSQLSMTGWSIADIKPSPIYTTSNGKSYAIRHVHGLPTSSWNVTLKFENEIGDPTQLDKNILIDMVGHYMHGKTQTSGSIDGFVKTLPTWVHVTPSLATIKSYKL